MQIPQKQTRIILLCSMLIVFQTSICSAAHLIESIHRTDENTSLQIYFRFTTMPEYKLDQREKRIDLILDNTIVSKNVTPFPPDDRLIRMLIKQKGEQTIFSLFFRYKPQSVRENTRQEPASLMLDIVLGNEFSSMYPDLSDKLQGITQLDRNSIDYTNPVNVSPYANDWRSFFQNYETSISISPPITFTLPPFPLYSAIKDEMLVEEWLPAPVIQLAGQGQWGQVLQLLRERLATEKDEHKRDLLLFTYAESLVRSGEYRNPHTLLQQIIQRHPDTAMADLANFLFVYLRNIHEPDFLGFYELEQAIAPLAKTTPYASYFTLLLGEAAMDIGRPDEAQKLLTRDDIAFYTRANAIRRMRLGDIRYIQDQKIKALVSYLQLNEQSDIINEYPESLSKFSDLLYNQKKYKQAVAAYVRLSELLDEKPQHDLVLFRLIMSRMHNGTSLKETENSLQQLREAFADTEGGYRATMKQADLDYLNTTAGSEETISKFTQLGSVANTVALREEAYFKTALVNHLEGNKELSIHQCMRLLREFQAGNLKTEAQALIIQQLEDVIADQVAHKRYTDALVLAQQNRNLFIRGWISRNMLYNLATAYTNLGFFDRAARTYQYLFDVSSGSEQEQVYLPLLQSLYFDGQYKTIEDYADRFSFRYPNSALRPPVFLLQLKALVSQGKATQAEALLDTDNRPTSDEIEDYAVQVYFNLGRWPEVIHGLTETSLSSQVETDRAKAFMLAEAYYQSGQPQAAEIFFLLVVNGEEQNDQARFRLAQIAQADGKREEALKMFQEIAETGTSPLWKKLAIEEVAIMQLKKK